MGRIGCSRASTVRLDTLLQLMVDKPQAEIVLEILESSLDLDQLNVELPEVRRVLCAQLGPTFVAPKGCPYRKPKTADWRSRIG